jgi:hypothetical protein
MTKLSDTQSIILSHASRHEGRLATVPANLPAAARQAVFRSMLKNLLLEEVPAPPEHRDFGWRQGDEARPLRCASLTTARAPSGSNPRQPSDIGTEPRELTAEVEART